MRVERFPTQFPVWTVLTIRGIYFENILFAIEFIARKPNKSKCKSNICQINIDSEQKGNSFSSSVSGYTDNNHGSYALDSNVNMGMMVFFTALNTMITVSIVCFCGNVHKSKTMDGQLK